MCIRHRRNDCHVFSSAHQRCIKNIFTPIKAPQTKILGKHDVKETQ